MANISNFYQYALVWAAIAYTLYKILNLLYVRRQHLIKSRKLECAPAPLWPATFLGISTIKQMMQAQKQGRFPAYLSDREGILSDSENRPVHTMRFSILGNEAHFTSDPKNIQALLATQFKDFGLGSARIGNFGPLMGDGIVSIKKTRFLLSRSLTPLIVRFGWKKVGAFSCLASSSICSRTNQ